jgi:hypothetical protein
VRAVIRRLHRLEERMTPRPNLASQRAAKILRERRRRRSEASGQLFEDLPPEPVPSGPVSYLSVAETLRLCRQERRERNLALQGGQR